MKKIFILLLLSVFSTTIFAKVTLSGKILNKPTNEIYIVSNQPEGVKWKNIKIETDDNGNFNKTFDIPKEGYYAFYIGKQYTEIYLKPNYKLNITLDYNDFDNSVKFSQEGKAINDYIKFRQLLDINFRYKNYKKNFALSESDFITKIKNIKKQKEKKLFQIKGEDEFKKIEKEKIYYDYLIKILIYQRYHRYITNNHEFKVSQNFLKPLQNVDLNNINDFKKINEYGYFLTEYLITPAQEGEESFKKIKNEFEKVKNPEIKSYVFNRLLRVLTPQNMVLPDLFNTVKSLATTEKEKKILQNRLIQLKNLSPSNQIPDFSFIDSNGKKVSLSDYKGNYLFLDVWATWCAPCKTEIPYLKKLHKKYKNKPIKFISISVDEKDSFDAWKKFINDNQMNWIQLYAENNWKSDFAKYFLIDAIPHFILLDKERKIISSNELRPSNKNLIPKLDKLLKGKK